MRRPADPPAVGAGGGDSPAHSLRWFQWLSALSGVPGLTRTDLVVALKLAERAVAASGRVDLDGWRPTKKAISQQLFGLGPSAIGNSYARLKTAGVIVEVHASTADGRPPLFMLVEDWRGDDADGPHRWDLARAGVEISPVGEEGVVEDATPRRPTSAPSRTAPSHVPAARVEGLTSRSPGRSSQRPVTSSPGLQTSLFPEATP